MKWPSACRWKPATPWTSEESRPKVLERYGAEPGKTSYANNCLVARRLAERGVRFIQLYHWGWDPTARRWTRGSMSAWSSAARKPTKPTAALLADLKARGLLEDTLVMWAANSAAPRWKKTAAATEMSKFIGRDHHPAPSP